MDGRKLSRRYREVVDVFRKGKSELLALIETKLKGTGKVSWCGVNGINACVQEMERAREGVAVLLNNVLIDFCVSSRIIWIKFRFSKVKVVVGMGKFVFLSYFFLFLI